MQTHAALLDRQTLPNGVAHDAPLDTISERLSAIESLLSALRQSSPANLDDGAGPVFTLSSPPQDPAFRTPAREDMDLRAQLDTLRRENEELRESLRLSSRGSDATITTPNTVSSEISSNHDGTSMTLRGPTDGGSGLSNSQKGHRGEGRREGGAG